MTLRRQVSLVLLLFPSDFIIAQKKSNFKPIFIQFESSNLALIRVVQLPLVSLTIKLLNAISRLNSKAKI